MEHLAEILTGVNSMHMLIEALLRCARLNGAGVKPSKALIKSQIETVVRSLGADLSDADITLTINVADGLTWRVDIAMVSNALQNVISNAVKYRRDGVRPTIHVSARTAPSRNIEVAIRDNGQGINPAHIARDPNVLRLTTNGDGRGIGLASPLRVVELHNGILNINSDGSSFTEGTIIVRSESVTDSLPRGRMPPVGRRPA